MLSAKKIHTDKAPRAIGPYSQAVRVGDLIFVSGQLPINPADGKLADKDITLQTKQVIDNLEAILCSEGLSLHHVVKCEVFLQHMSDFQAMNTIYAERFTAEVKPARQTIEVAGLPQGALVEISCIASA